MIFKGKSVLILGDSHSEGTASPGGQLSALLTKAGAAVSIDYRRGRSAYSFFRFEEGSKRLSGYRAQSVDVVIVFLGTNSTAYPRYWEELARWPSGTKVICIGPPTLPSKEQSRVARDQVVALQKRYFSRWIDLRPLSKGARRYPDQVHFHPKGAALVAQRIYDLLSSRSYVKKGRSNLGLSACIPLAGLLWVIDRRNRLA